jgi:hypothetical protein
MQVHSAGGAVLASVKLRWTTNSPGGRQSRRWTAAGGIVVAGLNIALSRECKGHLVWRRCSSWFRVNVKTQSSSAGFFQSFGHSNKQTGGLPLWDSATQYIGFFVARTCLFCLSLELRCCIFCIGGCSSHWCRSRESLGQENKKIKTKTSPLPLFLLVLQRATGCPSPFFILPSLSLNT